MARIALLFFGAALLDACTLLVPIDEGVSSGEPPHDAGLNDALLDALLDAPLDAPLDANDGPLSDAGDEAAPACPSDDPALVAWFRFDEKVGSIANDCSRNAIAAYAIGETPKWVPGRSGGAVDLDGEATCFEIPSPGRFAFEGRAFSVAAWIKPRQYIESNKTGRYIASHKTTLGWHFGTDDPDRIELDFDYGDAGKLQISGVVPLAAWTHVAAAYVPGTNARVWVNGLLTESRMAPRTFGSPASTPFRIGCRDVGANHFDGLIDDVRIWSRALEDVDVIELAR